MELWIRSQDREDLVKVDNLRILNNSNIAVNVRMKNMSIEYLIIGTYKTRERALEVLDEIQKYLTPTIQMLDETIGDKQVCQIGNIMTLVYEMPKE